MGKVKLTAREKLIKEIREFLHSAKRTPDNVALDEIFAHRGNVQLCLMAYPERHKCTALTVSLKQILKLLEEK